jgi:hypothetical protein
MMSQVTINFITEDSANDEYVLYLVEEGPWFPSQIEERMRSLQERIYNAVDAAMDGHVAAKCPDSKGRRVRVQVDCHDDPPPDVDEMVTRINDFVGGDEQYQRDVSGSCFVRALRVVTRSQMGRGRMARD